MMDNIRYRPTMEDFERIKPKPNMLKVSGDGVFATLQGEGVTAGSPAVFLRLHYCNLACGHNGGWKCDTGYTWDKTKPEFWQEPENWGYPETAIKIETSWNDKFPDNEEGKRIVITGGEPLLQQKKIVEFIKIMPNWQVEIETNGTIAPLPELYDCQINCSPKLENSGNPSLKRYKPEALKIINSLPNSWFKFVVSDPKDFEEIDAIVRDCNLDPNKILIMPEGNTSEITQAHLSLVKAEIETRGWKVANRNQLDWYGPKRRT